ncbi:MAG: FtsH-binding integral membrane protein, partial [Vicingaceae bacterium]
MIDYSNNNFNVKTSGVKSQDAVSTFLANVFTYMGGALAITGLLAYWFGNTPSL